MDYIKEKNITASMLAGNLNRMYTTTDPIELEDSYKFAKVNLEKLYLLNKERLHFSKKSKEVLK